MSQGEGELLWSQYQLYISTANFTIDRRMTINERYRDLISAIGMAVDNNDSHALRKTATTLEELLRNTELEKAHKAAKVLSIMGRVGDTLNTQKVFAFLKEELSR